MKKLALSIAVLGLLALGGQSFALLNTIDAVPAATLLLPYFEVDTTGPNGATTLFSINNASATAILTHVTVWSDQSVPVLDFDVYLTGYDVQTINMRDILTGNLPRTASVGQDGSDTISPQGPISQDINFASCAGLLPPPNPSATFQAHIIAALTGNPSPANGQCYGAHIRDGIARGYVTIDTVNACNLFFPSQVQYLPFLTFQNAIWGDVIYVNPEENFAAGETLVHIEASQTAFVPGDHTFYGRYFGASAIDGREALPTTLAARYVTGGAFTGGTDFIIWREGNAANAAYSCGLLGPAAWYPLDATQIVLFDEEENPTSSNSCPSGDPNCNQIVTIPNESQRINVATTLLPESPFGWAYLNLGHSKITGVYGDNFAQAWVITNMSAEGRYEAGFDAIQLDNANTPNTAILPVP